MAMSVRGRIKGTLKKIIRLYGTQSKKVKKKKKKNQENQPIFSVPVHVRN